MPMVVRSPKSKRRAIAGLGRGRLIDPAFLAMTFRHMTPRTWTDTTAINE
jgi:hypothetical protein